MYHCVRPQAIVVSVLLLLLLAPFSSVFATNDYADSDLANDSSKLVSARAQTTWSGTQTLTSSYTISIQDELIISACTIVKWMKISVFT